MPAFSSTPIKQHYIIWLAVILATDAIVAIPFARLRLDNKAIRFATLRLFNVLLIVLANIFFLYFCQHIYEGKFLPDLKPLIIKIYNPELRVGYVFLVNLGVNLLYIPCFGANSAVSVLSWIFTWLQPLLKYAYPLMFMGLAGMVNEVIDRILLKEWLPRRFLPRHQQSCGGWYLRCLLQTFHFHDAYHAGVPVRGGTVLLFAKPG